MFSTICSKIWSFGCINRYASIIFVVKRDNLLMSRGLKIALHFIFKINLNGSEDFKFPSGTYARLICRNEDILHRKNTLFKLLKMFTDLLKLKLIRGSTLVKIGYDCLDILPNYVNMSEVFVTNLPKLLPIQSDV